MIVYEVTGTEEHPVYKKLEYSASMRVYGLAEIQYYRSSSGNIGTDTSQGSNMRIAPWISKPQLRTPSCHCPNLYVSFLPCR